MQIRPLFAWYDLWVGAYIDWKNRRIYIMPLPCLGLVIELPPKYTPPEGEDDHD